MAVALSPTAARLVAGLPDFEQRSRHIKAVMAGLGNEQDRLDGAIAVMRRNLLPSTAAEHLDLHELQSGLPVNPPGKTLAQRQATVLALLQGIASRGSGLDWKAQLDTLVGSGWSFQENTPAAGYLTLKLPYSGVIAAPGGLGAAASTGGAFAAGTYRWAVTAVNSYGETQPSAQVPLTVTANQKVTLSWNGVAGATAYRLYRGTTAGNLRFRAEIAAPAPVGGVTQAASYVDTGGATTATSPAPLSNTTGSSQARDMELFADLISPANLVLVFTYGAGFRVNESRIGYEKL